ncbi:ParB N-terminal domain-containing protein [Roseobacter sp. YSTF-M11]|uniref:ParB N-terminal domain-containing protein n=1 Tax=Roseobacter insulae TaxID=2859783 RepID=A0A9X1FVA5_9RHOB|nr:ParB N-terminal domain-containing protein [Roseobacter insulae]MBW4708635.1 ParB N-terminal domain-containing protein [Roseobacter insulae]
MQYLEPIDLKGFRPATLRDQPQPSLKMVAIAELGIDTLYQRQMTATGRRAVQRIADEFDWTKFQPILVAPTELGKFAIVDGQHRASAAALVGLTAIPAMVVPMTLAQQALGFAAVNRDRIKIDGLGIYRAELAAGSQWAIDCQAAVEAGACQLATSNASSKSKKPGAIFAIGLIRKMVACGEAEAVSLGLQAVRRSICGTDPYYYTGPVLSVWLGAIARNQRYLRLHLSRVFDAIDIGFILDDARSRSRVLGKTSKEIALAHVERELRSRLKAKALCEGPTAVSPAADTGSKGT